mgnify:CR=1 FL=1
MKIEDVKELEDLFKTKEFKNLSFRLRLWYRFQIALAQIINL